MKIHVSFSLLQELFEYGRAMLPEEACGIILGRALAGSGADGVWEAAEWRPVRNGAPEGRHSFHFAPDQWVRLAYSLEQQTPEAPLRWIGVFHTHPDAPAIPSAEDLQGWSAPAPVCSWIISLTPRSQPELRVYRMGEGLFTELPVAVTARDGRKKD